MQAGGLGGMSVAQNGYGAGSLGAHAMGLLNNPSAVTSMGPITSASGGSSVAGTRLATMMGQGLLGGQQPQQQPQGRPFMPAQQQSAPSTGNAAYAPVQAPQVGMQPKDLERQKLLAQLRAQGYPV
jgi:hypothetical protein